MVTKIVGVIFLLGVVLGLETKVADDSDKLSVVSKQCSRQKCRDEGETICAKFKTTHRIFIGRCALVAHYCETGELYKPISGDCPPEAYNGPFPCPDKEDLVCAKSDYDTRVFRNYCEYNNYLMVLRRYYWTVPLQECIGLPDMPIQACTKIGGLPPGEVCAFDGTKYKLFPDLYAYNQEKCFVNGDWRRMSIIYC